MATAILIQYFKKEIIVGMALKNMVSRLLIPVIFSLLACRIAGQNGLYNIKHEEDIEDLTQQKMLPYHVLPVYGNASLGYYYVNLFIGSPQPQPQTVIIDTGSGILAVPCKMCIQCGKDHLNPPYNPTNSTANKQLTCGDKHVSCVSKCRFMPDTMNCSFSISYAQGSSLSGNMMEDDIRFETYAEHEQIRAAFGCTQRQTNLFVTQKANGIFGLAPHQQSNLLQQLINKHSLYSKEKKQFSLCLSSNGGIMTVGGINQDIHKQKKQPDFQFAFRTEQNLYSLVGLQEISLDETLIYTSLTDRLTGYGIFIDSGSTFSYLPPQKYTILEKKLNQTCVESGRCEIGYGQDSICYKLALKNEQVLEQEVTKMFPPIRYNINNKEIRWESVNYMLVREKNQVCLGIASLDRYLMGANWMYGRDIVFDIDNKIVKIYDGVTCTKQSKIMGRYLDDSADEIKLNQPFMPTSVEFLGFIVNTRTPMFYVGIILLTVSCLGFIFLRFFRDRSDRHIRVPIQREQESNQEGGEGILEQRNGIQISSPERRL